MHTPVLAHARRIAIAILVPAALAGCTLFTVDDAAPIDAVFVNVMDAADTLVFRADYSGERRGVWIVELAAGGPQDTIAVRHPFMYRSAGRDYHVSLLCPLDANCVDGPHYRARVDGGDLYLDPLLLSSSEATRQFRRVGWRGAD